MATDELQEQAGLIAEGELAALLARLPDCVRSAVECESDAGPLLEVVLDLGRPVEMRFAARSVLLPEAEITLADLEHVVKRVGAFGADNRAGLERTLHRISALRNRSGSVVGLTCRVGRAIRGSAKVVEDIALSGKSILLVGRPGVGKTTMLRETARLLADDAVKRVVIVDTSNEIAGDGDIPHPAIGRARRLQVPTPERQHAVMIEAVENHMPEVVVIDEMGTAQEALAARTIAERGVQLIATAHGNTLENLLANPTLSDLVGGVHAVTLSDEEARRRRTQKTVLERQAPPSFDVLVEIQSWERVAIHHDVGLTVDRILRGQVPTPEARRLGADGAIEYVSVYPVETQVPRDLEIQRRPFSTPADRPSSARVLEVYLFGVSEERFVQAAAETSVNVHIVDRPDQAELALTTKAHYRRRPDRLMAAEATSTPVYVLRRNTLEQMRQFLANRIDKDKIGGESNGAEAAALEAQAGVRQIGNGESSLVELGPQSSFTRRMQHQIAEQAKLKSYSTGREPSRRVIIHRG